LENAIGWYHSHPGYGCWLSGIDVSTQMLNQNFQEPFVAIVIDPVRTISAGKVCLGAFRTYPKVLLICNVNYLFYLRAIIILYSNSKIILFLKIKKVKYKL
jgi:hypothetical protein